MNTNALIIVVSGPSGTGKNTIIDAARLRDDRLGHAISATTRGVRPGEAEGVDYFYMSAQRFKELKQTGEIIESDDYTDHSYGTCRSQILKLISEDKDVVLDLTVKGALAIKAAYPEITKTVFILPPSVETLESRILGRGREKGNMQEIVSRIKTAVKEEIPRFGLFDYVIVNDNLDKAVDEFTAIIKSERASVRRNSDILDRLKLNASELKGEYKI